MMEKDMTRVVQATVQGHELWNGKPLTKLDVPAWGSKYPISLYGTTPEQQEILPKGETLWVELEADKLKDERDGSKPWDFYWSFVRKLSDEEAALVKPAGAASKQDVQQPQEEPRPEQEEQQPEQEQPQPWQVRKAEARQAAGYSAQDKDTAIRRAVALKAAVDLHGSGKGYEGSDLADVLVVADRFEQWLRG